MNGTPPDSDLPGDLSQPARRALDGAGIQRLEQLTQFSEADIKRLHGIGPKAMMQLRRDLAARGLSFADKPSQKRGGFRFPHETV